MSQSQENSVSEHFDGDGPDDEALAAVDLTPEPEPEAPTGHLPVPQKYRDSLKTPAHYKPTAHSKVLFLHAPIVLTLC
jgi:hypothetical protein